MSGARYGKRGFTLVEVLIAMGIASLLLGSMYSVYTSSYKSFRVQEQIAEAQQNARAAIQLMTRDIAMAGYSTSQPPPPAPPHPDIVDATNTTLTIRHTGKELAYSLEPGGILGRSENAASAVSIAERIRKLSFRFKNSTGHSLQDANGIVSLSNLVKIKQITISVTAGTPVFGRYSGSATFETKIRPRNL